MKALRLAPTLIAVLSTISVSSAAAHGFAVNTPTDSVDVNGCTTAPTCSLRDAIIAANADSDPSSTITLPAGDYKLTIAGQNQGATKGDLNVTHSLTINGAGASATTIDGNGIDRVFHVMCAGAAPCTDTTSLTLNGVTLTGGKPGPGLIVGATQVGGGAILYDPSGTLKIDGSVVSGNAASGGPDGSGGAIFTSSAGATIDITNSTFSQNKALGDGVGFGDGGSGGAICIGDPTLAPLVGPTLVVSNSHFDNNLAGGAAGSGAADWGGGGAIQVGCTSGNSTPGTVSVSGSEFSHNAAGGGANAYGDGGAIWILDSSSTPTITNSTFTANSAGGGGGGAFGEGGAIETTFPGLIVSGSQFTGNIAGGSSVGGTDASGEGGAIKVGGMSLAMTDSTVSGNVAGGGNPNAGGTGGGIWSSNDPGMQNTIVRSTISGNTSGGQNAYGEGGGIWANNVSVSDSTLTGNAAGGGGASGDGGAIDAATTSEGSTIAGNSVAVGTGAAGGGGVDGELNAHNTIVADNLKGGATNNCSGGTVITQGHNLENGTACAFNGVGDIHVEPNLGPLANNGGPTQTLALLPGSPAIDHGDNKGCLPTDQRGQPRPQGPACDIGAYEATPAKPPPPSPPSISGLTVKPGSFAPGKKGGSIAQGPSAGCTKHVTHPHKGKTVPVRCATVKYHDTLAALTTFKVGRLIMGVKGKHGGCVAAPHKKTGAKPCVLHVHLLPGSFTHQDAPGTNSFAFSGRLNGHPLALGRYRLATPAASGLTGAPATVDFTII